MGPDQIELVSSQEGTPESSLLTPDLYSKKAM